MSQSQSAAQAFEDYKNTPGVQLPGGDCFEAAKGFVTFCESRGLRVYHIFVEFDRGKNLVEHYMAWFPDELVAYDLAPQNPFDYDEPTGPKPAVDATHVVYTPKQILELGWRIGMNGLGWPGCDPGAVAQQR